MKSKIIILGSGSSMGVPRADGYWGKCNPKEKKNFRSRCSALISNKYFNILIDSSPDLRAQLIKNKIKSIDYVLYTHGHGDQTHGINDLRIFSLKSKKKIDIFADNRTLKHLIKNFSYCFKNTHDYPAILKANKLKKNIKFTYAKKFIEIKSITVKHGNINSIAYIINNECAYASDVNHIFDKDLKNFFNLKYLIIDCLRLNPHPAHFNLKDVLKLVKLTKPKKTILTNLHADLDYNYLLKILPKNVIPAYDGLSLNL